MFKHQLGGDKQSEALKESLFSTEGFSIIDTFKRLDRDNNGHITFDELQETATELNIQVSESILNLFDHDRDGKINYNEFARTIQPKDHNYHNYHGRIPYGLSQAEQDLRKEALDDELKKILEYSSSFEDELKAIRRDYNINAELVFAQIDDFNLGYISSNMVSFIFLTFSVG